MSPVGTWSGGAGSASSPTGAAMIRGRLDYLTRPIEKSVSDGACDYAPRQPLIYLYFEFKKSFNIFKPYDDNLGRQLVVAQSLLRSLCILYVRKAPR